MSNPVESLTVIRMLNSWATTLGALPYILLYKQAALSQEAGTFTYSSRAVNSKRQTAAHWSRCQPPQAFLYTRGSWAASGSGGAQQRSQRSIVCSTAYSWDVQQCATDDDFKLDHSRTLNWRWWCKWQWRDENLAYCTIAVTGERNSREKCHLFWYSPESSVPVHCKDLHTS